MITLTVSLQVRLGHLVAFVEAIRTNAERSFTDEPGCLSFDVSQDRADDHHFVLSETYTGPEAVEQHRSTQHFKRWREQVAEHVVPGSQVNTLANRIFHHHSPEADR
ncbi:putative quinol monooxygenase [Kribbella sp. NPDC051718]|uniref:putative quinol monooxygenase n=1 Tax=Kribbella sp. NPDC051718 TaxID=3155168 RepID=UPI0034171B35